MDRFHYCLGLVPILVRIRHFCVQFENNNSSPKIQGQEMQGVSFYWKAKMLLAPAVLEIHGKREF